MTEYNTENNTTTDALDDLGKYKFTVVAGKRYEVEMPRVGDYERHLYEVGQQARERYLEEHNPTDTFERENVSATVVKVDGQECYIPVPYGVSAIEAKRLLRWAVENADRELIDFDALAERLKEEDNVYYERVRDELSALDVDTFCAWLADDGELTFGYQVTADKLRELARRAEENYLGMAYDTAEFTEAYYTDTGAIHGHIPDEVYSAIDWEQVWDNALRYDVTEIDYVGSGGSHFFSNH